MTRALQKAFEIASQLPESEQDELAAAIVEQIRADEAWDATLAGTSPTLEKLPRKLSPSTARGRPSLLIPTNCEIADYGPVPHLTFEPGPALCQVARSSHAAGGSPMALAQYVGAIEPADLAAMTAAIEVGCETIQHDGRRGCIRQHWIDAVPSRGPRRCAHRRSML